MIIVRKHGKISSLSISVQLTSQSFCAKLLEYLQCHLVGFRLLAKTESKIGCLILDCIFSFFPLKFTKHSGIYTSCLMFID